MRRHTPFQQFREAVQIASDHRMHIVTCKTPDRTDYIVYRDLPDGRSVRLGKRSSVSGLRALVCRLAGPTHH